MSLTQAISDIPAASVVKQLIAVKRAEMLVLKQLLKASETKQILQERIDSPPIRPMPTN